MPATKLDLSKAFKADYAATRRPALVTIGKATYLAIDGEGEPGGAAFGAAIGALYAVAYTTKFASKFAGRDYTVSKLEAQWWGKSGSPEFHRESKSTWRWKLLVRTPDFVTKTALRQAKASLEEKGKGAEIDRVALETIREGRCVQALHVGPYDAEPETIREMLALAESEGLRVVGLHHEIYLSDPRRVAPAKLKTILRLPVAR
jgi:hypothetical protein